MGVFLWPQFPPALCPSARGKPWSTSLDWLAPRQKGPKAGEMQTAAAPMPSILPTVPEGEQLRALQKRRAQ